MGGRRLLAVDLLVAVHHRSGGSNLDRHLEGKQEEVAHLPAADVRGGKVPAGFAERVAGEVLERRDDTGVGVVALEATHVRRDHRPDQVRILADRLLDAPPSGITRHVGDRRQTLVGADASHLAADRRADTLDQLRIPRRAVIERRREGRRALRHVAGEAFLVADRGDTEPGPVHQPALQRIDRGGPDPRVDRSATERSSDLSDADAHGLVRVERRAEGRTHHARRNLTPIWVDLDPHRGQLRDLLLEAHTAQEVRHPVVDRNAAVAIRGVVGRPIVDSVAHAPTPVE